MELILFKTGVLVVVSFLRLCVAVPLIMTARRNRLTNLYWLSAQFLALVIALPFAATGAMNNPWIFWTFISLSEIALILFVQTTFYRGSTTPMLVLMVLAVLGLGGGLYGNAVGNFELSAWLVYPNAIWIWGWHAMVAYQAYRGIANERFTEDWVKARYKLMITYSILDCLGAIGGTALTTGWWVSSIGSLIIVAINVASVTMQILVWVMPEWFRRWLNRNYQPIQMEDAEFNEERS